MTCRGMEDINATAKRLVTALQRRDQNDLSFASERSALRQSVCLGAVEAQGTGLPFRAPGVGPG